MTDPPCQPFPERAEGDGPATNDSRPPAPQTQPPSGASPSSSTVTPPSRTQAPDPASSGGFSSPTGWCDLLWRLSGDHGRAAWCLVFTLVFLGTSVLVVWLIGPQLGAIMSGILGAAGGGAAVGGVQRARKSVRSKRANSAQE